ncbi:HAD family hydrolase [Kitasatospora viridis]|uniref:Putative hydrolase of the HAD superfamily n=1 Tax=Kitasatospora viridis TaxID=281105 RepID=A0A561ULK7_9ACTN|nr:HAD family phosphatase [Kitasatospora viridis]TWG00268.1 putative hydrolase of the HAD superfamily [Kitasatospora viridis]
MISERSFDAVLSDVDGVIRHFDHTELNRLELAAGLPAGETLRTGFAPEVDGPLLLGRITRAEWRASIAERLAERIPEPTARELAEVFTTAPFSADPEVVALLRAVRERVPLVLVTNATVWLDEDLARLGLLDLADAVVNSAEVGAVKPEPAIYRIAAERAGVAPERCLFVDDRAENVAAAAALGMTGLHFRSIADLRAVLG